MTKPTMIALGIAVAGALCAVAAVRSAGPARGAWAWTATACAVATAAYLGNRPTWLGKRGGRTTPWALVMLPYLVAFRIACALMRWWRGPDVPTLVAPGLWVGGRPVAATLPEEVRTVVDLVAEYPAPAWERSLPGYRSLAVLDGGQPPERREFLALVRELRDDPGGVLVHCDSGRGRAPTLVAAVLVARGIAADVAQALAIVRERRSVAAPTRADVAFLDAVSPELLLMQRRPTAGRSGRA